jgi:hypothetical protein
VEGARAMAATYATRRKRRSPAKASFNLSVIKIISSGDFKSIYSTIIKDFPNRKREE